QLPTLQRGSLLQGQHTIDPGPSEGVQQSQLAINSESRSSQNGDASANVPVGEPARNNNDATVDKPSHTIVSPHPNSVLQPAPCVDAVAAGVGAQQAVGERLRRVQDRH